MPVLLIYVALAVLVRIFGFLKPKAKKVLGILVLVIAVIAGGAFLLSKYWEDTNSNPFNYARVTSIEYTAVIRDEPDRQLFDLVWREGQADIKQRVTFDIRQSQNAEGIWELWIPLPETEWAYDTEIFGLERNYRITSVKQILDDGTEVEYEESPKLYWDWEDYKGTGWSSDLGPGKWYHSKGPYNGYNRFECVLFYVDNLREGQVTFEFEYEMTNAALRYNDSSEVYLVFAYGNAIVHLESFKAQVVFLNEIMPRPGNYDVYTYGTNSHELPFTESTDKYPGYHTFSIELDKSQLRFRPYNRYLEFALIAHGEDKHIFTQNAKETAYSNYNMLPLNSAAQAEYEALPGRWLTIKLIVFALCLLFTFPVVRHSFKIDERMNKKHKFYTPANDIPFFRDIPADIDSNFAAVLVFCKHKTAEDAIDKDGYAAVLLSLVRKGYVELDRINIAKGWDYKNMKLIVKYRPPAAQSQPANAPAAQQPQKFCHACGTANKENAVFCCKCGIQIHNHPIQPPASQQTQPQSAWQQPYNAKPQPQPQYNPQYAQMPDGTVLEPLSEVEELYFNLILRHTQQSPEIPLSIFENRVKNDYGYTSSFVENVKSRVIKKGINDGYFQTWDFNQPYRDVKTTCAFYYVLGSILLLANAFSYNTRMDFAFGGFVILGLGFIVSALYMQKHAYKYHLLTQFGEDEYAKWRGLYNFLDSSTLMNERTVIELPLWEKYLIYATEFGIAEKVVKALEVRGLDMNLNTNSSALLRNPYYRSRGFYISSRSFRYATRSAVSRSAAASGGGGGGAGVGGGG